MRAPKASEVLAQTPTAPSEPTVKNRRRENFLLSFFKNDFLLLSHRQTNLLGRIPYIWMGASARTRILRENFVGLSRTKVRISGGSQ
jgi:hypothetical protein